mgnify:CR=1 FL=1
MLGAVLLPSYTVTADPDKYNRRFAFKAEHENMKTHYFAADHKYDMEKWMRSMRLASELQRDPM